MLPKRGCDASICETAKFYRTDAKGFCQVISFTVPRKSEIFQADLYPDTQSGESALSAEDFQANAVGQATLPSNQVPMAYTYPQMLGAPCRLENDFGMGLGNYQERPNYPSNRQGDFTRLSTVYMTTDGVGPDMNVSYTDGMQTMSFEFVFEF